MKIAVLGFSGSGKSTLAKQLSEYYDIPLLYLDCVNFEKIGCCVIGMNAEKWLLNLCRTKAGL